MTVIAVGSVAGAPGATRLALGLVAVWPVAGRRRVLVEADPDGGRLGSELGIGVEPGLMALALAARTQPMTADAVVGNSAAVADWHLVPAPSSAEQAHSALVHGAPALAEVLAAGAWHERRPGAHAATDWFVDAGRLTTRSPALALAKVADHVLIVTAGSFSSLALMPHRVEALRAAGCHVEVVVVEPTPWSPAEISDFIGADVLGLLPRVRTRRNGVVAMRSNAWRPWWNAVDTLADRLVVEAPDDLSDASDATDVADDVDEVRQRAKT